MGVTVELNGPLVARTGVLSSDVPVNREATVADVVERLSQEYGDHVRAGLMEEWGRLRSDTRAVRESADRTEPISTDSTVVPGETVRFELVD